MLTFDDEMLQTQLLMLPLAARIAFAASCSERLLPGYRRYAESEGSLFQMQRLRSMLDVAWSCVEAGADRDDRSGLVRVADEAVDIAPETIDDYSDDRFFAQCAAVAIGATLMTASGDPDVRSAMGPAQRAEEVIELIIESGHAIDAGAIAGHPMMQAELHRQRRDLAALAAAWDTMLPEVARILRTRAATEQIF